MQSNGNAMHTSYGTGQARLKETSDVEGTSWRLYFDHLNNSWSQALVTMTWFGKRFLYDSLTLPRGTLNRCAKAVTFTVLLKTFIA